MRRRKLRWASVALVALALLALGGHVSYPRPTRLTWDQVGAFFEKLEEGEKQVISRQEVEEAFGPPGDYRTRPTQRFVSPFGSEADTWLLEGTRPADHVLDRSDKLVARPFCGERPPCRPHRNPVAAPSP